MRQRLLIFVGLGFLLYFVFALSQEVLLPYFFLSTLWLFPLFYFAKEQSRFFLYVSAACISLFHSWYFISAPSAQFAILLGIQGVLFCILYYYQKELKNALRFSEQKKEEVHQNLKSLQGKYQMRLNSLKHLEMQVSSLMNLFEIARDFSECMNFSTLAEFLLKKLHNELAFQKMQIFIFPKSGSGMKLQNAIVYEMMPAEAKVADQERELTQEEKESFEILRKTKAMLSRKDSWYFPVIEGDDLGSVFSIHGIKEDDLARVEVLSAYLVLLIKKIKLYETVRELAIVDELTQVFVRHHFMERLEEELKRSIRFKLPVAVLMLDIDHFKRYNDDFGHLVGDATLKDVSDLLKKNLRRVDLVGRYGGEEFVVAMPETKVAHAAEVAERIRSNIARNHFQVYNVETKVTVSQGLAIFDGELIAESQALDIKTLAADLIRQADEAMYKAKEEGRNRVCLYKDIQRS